MATTEKELYAMLGVDPPNEQPEAADPAGQGANEPSVAETAGRENQATDTSANSAESPVGSRCESRTATPGATSHAFGQLRQQATGDPSSVSPEGLTPALEVASYSGAAGATARKSSTGPRPVESPEGEGFETGDADSSASPQNDNGGTGEPAPAKEGGTGRQIAGATGEDGSEPMPREERARQARLRREREMKAAVDAAVQAALKDEREKNDAQMKAMFESAGMVDRYHDNKPITTLEEFNAFQAARQADRLSRELQGGRLTPESFQAAIDNSPAVKAAQAAVERLEAREKADGEAARKAEFERKVADELAEIHRMDPTVNTINDVLAMPTGNEFARLVRENGLSFLQAFKLANADSLAEARVRAAREGEARNAASKNHLRSIQAGGQTSVDVPTDVIANYRMFDPTITMEEIRRDYAKRYGK